MGDFEVRCNKCNHVLSTEESEKWEKELNIAIVYGNSIACTECKHVGISAYFGNRGQDLWTKIHYNVVAAS